MSKVSLMPTSDVMNLNLSSERDVAGRPLVGYVLLRVGLLSVYFVPRLLFALRTWKWKDLHMIWINIFVSYEINSGLVRLPVPKATERETRSRLAFEFEWNFRRFIKRNERRKKIVCWNTTRQLTPTHGHSRLLWDCFDVHLLTLMLSRSPLE